MILFMKNKFIWISALFFILTVNLFSQSFEYSPFFAVKVIDNEETEFLFSDMKYFDSKRNLKYFFWIRRGSEQGTATYQLDFKKIKSIDFTGDYDSPIPEYTQGNITLTSGEVFDVLINSTGSIGGIDKDFGVYGEVYMNYNIVQSIEFIHEGTFMKCPFCGAIFYDTDLENCSFDETPLEHQHTLTEDS